MREDISRELFSDRQHCNKKNHKNVTRLTLFTMPGHIYHAKTLLTSHDSYLVMTLLNIPGHFLPCHCQDTSYQATARTLLTKPLPGHFLPSNCQDTSYQVTDRHFFPYQDTSYLQNGHQLSHHGEAPSAKILTSCHLL